VKEYKLIKLGLFAEKEGEKRGILTFYF